MSFISSALNVKNLKKLILLLLIQYSSSFLFSQPSNDNCSTAINLGKTPYCSEISYTNINATSSDIGNDNNAACFIDTPPQNDVWFSFSPSIGDEELNITIEGVAIGGEFLKNIQAAVYRGACFFDAMVLRNCAVSNNDESILSFNVSGLSPGELYFLRIDNFGGDAYSGDFKICIEERYVYNIKDDEFSSKCSGILYDSGGENGNYIDNEDFTFTICPGKTADGNQVKSIEFEFSYYHLPLINQGEFEYDTIPDQSGRDGDKISIYLGQDTTFAKYLEINGNADYYFFDGLIFGGGVDFENCLNSDCITLKFESDDTLNAEGFKFKWQCKDLYCEIKDSILLQIDTTVSNAEILDYLLIKGVQGEITNLDCSPSSLGIFENQTDDIGFNRGLILSNGSAINAIGPNDSHKSSFALHKKGDEDLDSLSSFKNPEEWVKSYDGCIVELDVIPYADEINYKYVFGSEEYHEFVNNDYNDIFALFISGIGITGIPGLNGKENMALIPGTEDYVEINSVNGSKNWQYYHSNYLGRDIQYDGLVWDSLGKNHFLYARKKVIPCETYHLKYAIADRLDSIYDSGVFIGELTDGRPKISFIDSEDLGFFIDNCDIVDGNIVFSLSFPLDKDVTYDIEVSGSAEKNIDYIIDIPDQLIFLAGETQKEFKITIIEDDLIEGVESIKIKLLRDLVCGRKELAELEIEIYDQLDIDIVPEGDTLIYCYSDSINLVANGADFLHWEPQERFDFPDSNNVFITTDDDIWVTVKGRLIDTIYDKCYGSDSIFINKFDFDFYIEGDSIRKICSDKEVNLTANIDNLSFGKITWGPQNLFAGDIDSIAVRVIVDSINPINPFVYAFYEIDGCEFKDSVRFDVIDSKAIVIKSDPVLDVFICDTITLFVESDPGLNDKDSILWSLAGNFWNVEDDEILLEVDRETTVLNVKIIDEYGCEYTLDTFLNAKEREVLFPNAIFVGDEKNEVFKFYKMNSCTEVQIFQIFNRWGELVFDCDNDQCAKKGWDATYRGKPVSPGVYLYKCIIKNSKGIIREYKGNLLVFK